MSEEASMISSILILAGSSTAAAFIAHWFGRRKQTADAAAVSVATALLIEERAVLRYHSANEALDAAQAALNAAREQINFLECHIISMHDVLTKAGLHYELPPGLLELIKS